MLPSRWERYKDSLPPTGAPKNSYSRTATSRMGSLLQPSHYLPESRHKRPLDASQAPGLCSAQGARGRAACLALQGMGTKNLSEGHVHLQCLITAEGYLGSRLQPLPCSRPPPAPAGAHSAMKGHLARGRRWEGKAQGHAPNPRVRSLLSGPPFARRQRCPAHSLAHAADAGAPRPQTPKAAPPQETQK